MNNLVKLITLGGALSASLLNANNVILQDTTNFSAGTAWLAGANLFVGGEWSAFATLEAPDRVVSNGDGSFTFNSYDDGVSDGIEAFLYQEFNAGIAESEWPNQIFATGDVIVFKGEASATRSGADTSDMIVRAFIKVLGYNELQWEFQTKAEYSAFHNIGAANEAFELSVVFPDIAVDTSLQVLQLGFEITTQFDGNDMDSGTITFSNLEGYIVGDGNGGGTGETWAGIEIDANGNVDTGDFLGLVHVTHAPWVYLFGMSILRRVS